MSSSGATQQERLTWWEKIALLEEKVKLSRGSTRGHSITASMGVGPITADSNLTTTTDGAVGGVGDVEASIGELMAVGRAAKTPSSLSVSATPFEPVTTVIPGYHPLMVTLPSVSSAPSTHVVLSATITTLTAAEVRSLPISGVERTTPTPAGASAGATGTVTTVRGPNGATDGGAIIPPVAHGAACNPAGTATTDVVTTMTLPLQAQTKAMTAQAKAVAVQGLPSLPRFTGEGSDAVVDGFDKWIQKFREGAKFAGWSAANQLYQLELHLDKTALDVFHMLPDSESKDTEDAITALGMRFKPTDIEELCGLQFHHLSQGDESIDG